MVRSFTPRNNKNTKLNVLDIDGKHHDNTLIIMTLLITLINGHSLLQNLLKADLTYI